MRNHPLSIHLHHHPHVRHRRRHHKPIHAVSKPSTFNCVFYAFLSHWYGFIIDRHFLHKVDTQTPRGDLAAFVMWRNAVVYVIGVGFSVILGRMMERVCWMG
jgi:hypothetical protein